MKTLLIIAFLAIAMIAKAQESIDFKDYVVNDNQLVSELAIQHFAHIYTLESVEQKDQIIKMYCDILTPETIENWRVIIAATKGLWLVRGFQPTADQFKKINLIPKSALFKHGNVEKYYRDICEMIFLRAYLKLS